MTLPSHPASHHGIGASHVRKADVARVHSLRRGAAEAIEAIAHGDSTSSSVVGRRINELKLPSGVTIGAIVRGEEVLIAHDDVLIATDDHVILFMVDKTKVSAETPVSSQHEFYLTATDAPFCHFSHYWNVADML